MFQTTNQLYTHIPASDLGDSFCPSVTLVIIHQTPVHESLRFLGFRVCARVKHGIWVMVIPLILGILIVCI